MPEKELIIEKVIEFLFHKGGFEGINRPGINKINENIFRTGLKEYLNNGKNVFLEYDAIRWLSSEINNGSCHDYYREVKILTHPEIKFAKKLLKREKVMFWNIYEILSEEEIEKIKEKITFSEKFYKRNLSYMHNRTKGFSKEIKQEVLIQSNYSCNNCGITKKELGIRNERLEIDHIIPIFYHGENVLTNAQALCKSCHKEKTKKEAYPFKRPTFL